MSEEEKAARIEDFRPDDFDYSAWKSIKKSQADRRQAYRIRKESSDEQDQKRETE
jgi:hypothetical protein